MGEMVHNNLTGIAEYHYSGNQIQSKEFYTYCLAVGADGYCLSPRRVETDIREIWLNKQGLPDMEYSYYPHNLQRYLLSKYYYLFYE